MATTEIKEALKNVADQLAKYVEDAATMTVETSYVEMGGNAEDAKLAARTIIRLDGDSTSVLPMKKGADGTLVVDTGVYEVHQQNVKAASDYRAAILERLMGVLRGQ
ncbi:MAG: hypothetical protein WA821_17725 [Anaerolineales bacterium]